MDNRLFWIHPIQLILKSIVYCFANFEFEGDSSGCMFAIVQTPKMVAARVSDSEKREK